MCIRDRYESYRRYWRLLSFRWIFKLLCGICVYCKGVDIMSILQDLWYGIIKPNEDKFITEGEKNLVQLITRHYETLSSSLNDDEREILKKYAEFFTEYTSLIESQAFEIGFKLAVKFLTCLLYTSRCV